MLFSLVIHGKISNNEGLKFKVLYDNAEFLLLNTNLNWLEASCRFENDMENGATYQITKGHELVPSNIKLSTIFTEYRKIKPKEKINDRGTYIAVSIITSDNISQNNSISYLKILSEVHANLSAYINEENAFKEDFKIEKYEYKLKNFNLNVISVIDTLCDSFNKSSFIKKFKRNELLQKIIPDNLIYFKNGKELSDKLKQEIQENTKQESEQYQRSCNKSEEIINNSNELKKLLLENISEMQSSRFNKIEILKNDLEQKDNEIEILKNDLEQKDNEINKQEETKNSLEKAHGHLEKKSLFEFFNKHKIKIIIICIVIIVVILWINKLYTSYVNDNSNESNKSTSLESSNTEQTLILEYQNSCKQNSFDACTRLGNIFVELNKADEASQWYQKACEGNYSPACYKLGNLYSEQDSNNSLDFYTKACELSDFDACKKLGEIYNKKNNNKESKKYYQKSCKIRPNWDKDICKTKQKNNDERK
jgi:regulation of enolase protein 1 (concanavalin A-like superfamily)